MRRQFGNFIGIAIAALALPGCVSMHPLLESPCEVGDLFQTVDEPGRAGVYVFLVNGNDPLGWANLKGVREYLTQLGFTKTYFGDIGHEAWMAEELVCMHRDHPGSRFVVVGYEYGADSARRIAQAGLNRGATIDLLLYLEPKGTFFNVPNGDPAIHRTVLVRNDRWLTRCAPVDGAELITVSTINRFGVPKQPEVLDLLANEVSHLASLVPIVEFAPEPVPPLLDETAPTPRPLKARKPQPVDEWDFLKLVSRQPFE